MALVTLGCARNEVDSEELAGRLADGGWTLVDEPADADAVVVNTCGFVDTAKQDSIDTLLAAADLKGAGGPRAVVAVGCLAERYGGQLAASLPEADAVLGFDHYADISRRLDDVLAGHGPAPHTPRDRRTLLPISPVDRAAARAAAPAAAAATATPAAPAAPDLPPGIAPASGPRPVRRRLAGGPVAPLKLASGCDRRCTFCAIPAFRGSFVSRPVDEVLGEAHWLAEQGVREIVLVSENSTSYGKDLGDVRLLEKLLPQVAAVPGVVRVRANYLQPAEMRPSLVEVIAATPGVAPYFDLSFQHASAALLRRMRRFGDVDAFLDLLRTVRLLAPEAGVRSNFIVGFPGETADELADLERFLIGARLDAAGFFAYSDEDGTEAAGLAGKVDADVAAQRLADMSSLAEALTAERAQERIGTVVEVLVESVHGGLAEGRAAHQAPEVDGTVGVCGAGLQVGDLVRARVRDAEGVDLVADLVDVVDAAVVRAAAS
ncbi:MAG TPA: 30S ribosomal protein S12 methylthiotransferase RimO [Mycobacteriales bacterium]|nr:30S ribosomal protein S12 methylthiotransferase RimO [Mycobacteriales bacterium]